MSPSYHRWHLHPRHELTHWGVFSVHIFLILAIASNFWSVPAALAGSAVFSFTTAGDYIYDAQQIEVTGTQARLKSHQYTGAETGTAAYWNLDETSGNAANDSSTNNNDLSFSSATPCTGGTWSSGKVVSEGVDRSTYGASTFSGMAGCVSAADSASLSPSSQITLEAYVKFASAFSSTSTITQGVLDKGNYRLYFDETDGKLKFEMDDDDAKTWTKIGGSALTPITPGINGNDGINGSWRQLIPGTVTAIQEFNSELYIGTSGAATNLGTGEVWKYSGSNQTWTKVGGDGNGTTNWDTTQTEGVFSMAVHSSALYAGLGLTSGDAEIWRYTSGTTWTKVAGGSVNGSWTAGQGIEFVGAMVSDGSYLYAGTGSTSASAAASDADVWRWNGSTWTIIGGTNNTSGANVNTSWGGWVATTNAFESVRSMVVMGGNLYVGLGDTAAGASYADAEVWRCTNCGTSPTWTLVGGDGTGWAASTFEYAYSLATDGTKLYVGLGSTASDADVWECSSCGTSPSWTQIGGNEVHGSKPNWNTGYETVYGLAYIGGKLYASLGLTAGEAEVWRYDSTSWTKVAGDGVNSTWDASFATPPSTTNIKELAILGTFGATLIAGTGTTPQDAEVWSCSSCDSSPAWSEIGGRDFRSWGSFQPAYVTAMAVNDGNLYAATGTTNKNASVWEYNGSTWAQVGGGNLHLSSGYWDNYEYVLSMTSFKGNLIAGFGNTVDDSDVWQYWDDDSNGATPKVWTQIGGTTSAGSTVNNGWTDANNIEEVASMVADEQYLYAGTGNSASDGDIWRYDGSTWGGLPIGGSRNDTNVVMNSSWAASTYERVQSIKVANGLVFAGLGSSAGDAEVWRWNGSTWGGTRIGGDGLGSTASWNGTGDVLRESIRSMTFIDTTMYVALGDTNDASTAADAEVWACSNCMNTGATPSWTKIGGDGVNGSWDDLTYEQVTSIISYKGNLIATLGINNTGSDYDSEMWEYNGSTWSRVGGDAGTSDTWSGAYELAGELISLNGKLYTGLGLTSNAATASDAEVWEYGANAAKSLASSKSAWETGKWYHIAGTYDGTTARLWVCDSTDISSCNTAESSAAWGSITLADNAQSLALGSLHGALGPDRTLGGFDGFIDEARVMNTAQSSFTLTQFASTSQVIRNATALSRNGVLSWSEFDATETANGGTILYRLSDNGGSSWKYFSGGSWVASSGTIDANTKAVIDANIASFPVTSSGLLWQAVMTGNGDQQVIIDDVSVGWTDDLTDPVNPSTLTSALNEPSGTHDLTTNTWYNYPAPSFTWAAGTDVGGSGVAGYYVYFGESNSANPELTSGIINGGGAVQFQSGATLNFAGTMTNGKTYYLLLKTKDNAGNITDTATQLFIYKYDNLNPTPPSTISVSPSGYTSVNTYTFLWPSTGPNAAQDVGAPTQGSGLAGYQYKTGATSGEFSDWSDTITDTTVTLDDVAYQEGVNTYELRVLDNAGNISSTVSVSYYFAGNAPSGPQHLVVSPETTENTPEDDNNFSFHWDEPEFFNGSIRRYHYSINRLPSATNTSTTTLRELSAGAYATQQGKNSFYVVAEDEAGNVNYNTYASVDFYTITPAPGAPTAVQIFDISNRDTQEYAISMKWTEPVDQPGGFDGYEVYRSSDGVSFETAGTTQSPVFVDTGLDSSEYTFYVKSKDNAGQYSVASSAVAITPTGRFTTPPEMSEDPTATAKAFSASVAWETDRVASSFIEYGTDKDNLGTEEGGETVGTLDLVERHSIALPGLDPETTYFYQAVWVDQDGNQGRSDTLSFQTGLRPKISDVVISNITLNAATVSWVTTTVSTSSIHYGTTRAYGKTADDSSSSQTTRHSLRLDSLQDSTTYYLVITGEDTDENTLTSDEYSFTTLTKPSVSSLGFEPVKDAPSTTLRITWKTNVPTTSIVQYQLGNSALQTASTPEYVTSHEILVDRLAENAEYQFQVRSVDEYGNAAVSDVNTITTPDDSRPPQVSNLTVEVRSSGAGQEQRAQLVVSWETDEPSTSQIEYGPGISSASYPSRTQEDPALTNTHVVIVPELEPAKLYHLRAVSRDRAQNAGTSSDTTSITGKVQRSVIDIIVSALQRSLGFLSSVPGFQR